MPNYTVEKYSSDNYDEWQDFVQNSVNGTLFHEQKFISYHESGKFDDSSLMIYKGDELFAIFPAAIVEKENFRILKSHPGTSYGGVIFKSLAKLKDIIAVLSAIEDYSKDNGISKIEFRQAPKIFIEAPFDQFDFALVHLGYTREDQELSTCYQLPIYKDKSIKEMVRLFGNDGRNKVRKNVRKAIRAGLEFRELKSSEIEKYYEILTNNLQRHNASPAHSLTDIMKLKELYPSRVKLFGVFIGNNMAAGYMIFNINEIGWHVFYGSLNYEYQKDRPTTFGLFMLLKVLADEEYAYLNMGISTEDGGKKVNWSLLDFKESFNGTGIIRTYWSKNIE